MLMLSSLAGCIGDDGSVESDSENSLGTVMVSTYHVEQLVSAIAGDLLDVEMMSTTNIPAHDYSPSALDIIRLQSSDLFLYHGLGLEPWVNATLENMGDDAPTSAMTHTMPTGQEALDYESILVGELCTALSNTGSMEALQLGEDAHDAEDIEGENGAYTLQFPEHEDDEHHEGDEHHEDDEHHEGDDHHDDHEAHHVEAEETLTNVSGCPTGTVVSIYHLEPGHYVLNFEAEEMESFNMALAMMGGAHHHHEHGDEHGDEHGVCHDMSDHSNNNISDEAACVAAGFVWMEEGHEGHDECHNITSHANEDIDNQVDCEAAGHEWIEHGGHMEPAAIMLGFDTNNDSHLSWDELMEVFIDDDHDHDHDDRDDHHEAHHNVALVYPDGTSAMVDVEHDSLPENATGWNLTWAAMSQNNISVNSTYGTFGNYVSGIAGFEAPGDFSWYWELHTWNTTSDGWEASDVGVDSVMVGHETDHIAWAPNSTDDSTIPHPEDDHDDVEHELEMAMNNFLFSTADANNDGLLNLSELEHFAMDAQRMENMPEPGLMASAFMSVFDEDNSSSLSMSEFTEVVEFNTDEDGHEDGAEHSNETMASNHSEDDADGHDHMNATEMAHHLFSMHDGNNDSVLNLSELTAVVAFMNEDDHDEGAFLKLDIDEMGDYGMALPVGVTVELVMEGEGHAGHGDHAANGHDDGDHAEDDHDDDHGDDDDHNEEGHDEELAFDPHSWLDPLAFKAQMTLVTGLLSTSFPDGADAFEANAAQYMQALDALDNEFVAAFGPNGSCDADTVASNHNAYAYLSARYGIQFVTVHGLDPEGEPSAEDIAEVVESVSENNISVMFIEEYTDASAVDSIVDQTGVQVLTLYTMEMAPSDSDDTYISMMTKNLNNLKTGLDCL